MAKKTEKAAAARPVVSKDLLVEVGEVPGNLYTDHDQLETVVPHTNLTGGIEGTVDPYPPVVYRRFDDGESCSVETQLTDIKRQGSLRPPPAMESKPSVVDENGGEAAMDVVSKDSNHMSEEMAGMEKIMGAMMEKLERMRAAEIPFRVVPPSSAPPTPPTPPAPPSVGVSFQGAFGSVTAPFKTVVEGGQCVALVNPVDSSFTYEPPVDDQQDMTISWTDQSGMSRTRRVVHAGLQFELPGEGRVTVLLTAD